MTSECLPSWQDQRLLRIQKADRHHRAITHHAVVEPLRNEIIKQFGVNQLPVVQVQSPEGEHHKLKGRKKEELEPHPATEPRSYWI